MQYIEGINSDTRAPWLNGAAKRGKNLRGQNEIGIPGWRPGPTGQFMPGQVLGQLPGGVIPPSVGWKMGAFSAPLSWTNRPGGLSEFSRMQPYTSPLPTWDLLNAGFTQGGLQGNTYQPLVDTLLQPGPALGIVNSVLDQASKNRLYAQEHGYGPAYEPLVDALDYALLPRGTTINRPLASNLESYINPGPAGETTQDGQRPLAANLIEYINGGKAIDATTNSDSNQTDNEKSINPIKPNDKGDGSIEDGTGYIWVGEGAPSVNDIKNYGSYWGDSGYKVIRGASPVSPDASTLYWVNDYGKVIHGTIKQDDNGKYLWYQSGNWVPLAGDQLKKGWYPGGGDQDTGLGWLPPKAMTYKSNTYGPGQMLRGWNYDTQATSAPTPTRRMNNSWWAGNPSYSSTEESNPWQTWFNDLVRWDIK